MNLNLYNFGGIKTTTLGDNQKSRFIIHAVGSNDMVLLSTAVRYAAENTKMP
jgi:hypothetical protein